MEIQEIRKHLGITQVLAHYGLAIKKGHVNCPFHEDKKPSMKVYEDSNTVYCFSGNCEQSGKSMDVIEFVQQKEGCSKYLAIKKCKELLGYFAPLESIDLSKEVLQSLWSNFVVSFKSQRCKARAYVQGRGLSLEGVGYNTGIWHKRQGRRLAELEQAEALGYLLPSVNNSGKNVWGKNCIIFPLRNQAGKVCSFYGRGVKVSGHYYMRNRSGLYPSYPRKNCKRVILTESVIDAASLGQIKELTEQYETLALYGTNGYTKEHQAALRNLEELEEVVLMLDGDEAGAKASRKLAEQLRKELPAVTIKIVTLPSGTDVNELWANHTNADLFIELLEGAEEQQPFKEAKKALDLEIIKENYYLYEVEELKIEVLGGIAIEQLDKLQCTLRITRKPQRNALDKIRQSVNLYNAGQVKGLVTRLHDELELPMQSLRLIIANLTEELEAYRTAEQRTGRAEIIAVRRLTTARKRAALAYLESGDLLENTWTDLSRVGIVGEKENALIMYLCFSSRKLEKPLHVISLGSSGSGKTHLQESIGGLMPEEEVMNVTSLSDQALYYYPKDSLKNKLFLVEDLDGMSEDAQYALRELKSKGRLSKYVPVKDDKGKSSTQLIEVEGPICFGGCTTRERLYEDNANRCLLLYRDESKQHKEAVMQEQRRAAAGKVNKLEQEQLKEQFKDVQMLLEPITVVNPYAEALVLPSRVFKPLRTNAHYLQFIEVITFYHQHQRKRKKSQSGRVYIETTLEDIEWANRLMKGVLLSKSDELSWGVRDFLEKLKDWLKDNELESFKSQQIRDALRIDPENLKYYLRKLKQYGQLKVIGGSRYTGLEYEVVKLEEYEELKQDLNSVLDRNLEKIRS